MNGVSMEFFDTRCVEDSYFLERRLTQARKHEGNPVIEPCKAMQSVLREEGGRFRMWYSTYQRTGRTGIDVFTLHHAESEDGLKWSFPELGLKELNGNRRNNIIIVSDDKDIEGKPLTGSVGTEGFCVIDLKASGVTNASSRYAAMYLTNLPQGGGLCLAYSDDGYRWKAHPGNPVFRGWPDMFNNFFFDSRLGRYVLYHRPEAHAGPHCANRMVARSESDDLVHWDNTRIVLSTDGGDAAAVGTVDEGDGQPRGRDFQFYGMTVTPYNGLYLGIAEYYDVVKGRLSVKLFHSFDGIDWRRETNNDILIPQSPGAWDSECIGYVQAGSPVRVGDDLYFYYGGMNTNHHDAVKCAETPNARRGLGIGIVPCGRLAGYHAGKESGELLTRPFILNKSHLTINANAIHGDVKAGLTDESGRWISGFSFDDAIMRQDDKSNMPLAWKGNSTIEKLTGKTVRLRISARNAALYGINQE